MNRKPLKTWTDRELLAACGDVFAGEVSNDTELEDEIQRRIEEKEEKPEDAIEEWRVTPGEHHSVSCAARYLYGEPCGCGVKFMTGEPLARNLAESWRRERKRADEKGRIAGSFQSEAAARVDEVRKMDEELRALRKRFAEACDTLTRREVALEDAEDRIKGAENRSEHAERICRELSEERDEAIAKKKTVDDVLARREKTLDETREEVRNKDRCIKELRKEVEEIQEAINTLCLPPSVTDTPRERCEYTMECLREAVDRAERAEKEVEELRNYANGLINKDGLLINEERCPSNSVNDYIRELAKKLTEARTYIDEIICCDENLEDDENFPSNVENDYIRGLADAHDAAEGRVRELLQELELWKRSSKRQEAKHARRKRKVKRLGKTVAELRERLLAFEEYDEPRGIGKALSVDSVDDTPRPYRRKGQPVPTEKGNRYSGVCPECKRHDFTTPRGGVMRGEYIEHIADGEQGNGICYVTTDGRLLDGEGNDYPTKAIPHAAIWQKWDCHECDIEFRERFSHEPLAVEVINSRDYSEGEE